MQAYGSDGEFETWMTAMGFSLPQGATAAGARVLGSSLLDGAYGNRFSGQVADPLQDLEWPRLGAYRGLSRLPSDAIPQPVIFASYFLGQYALNNPGAFFTGGASSELVKRETIGPMTTEYAVSTSWTPEQLARALSPVFPFVDGLVSSYLKDPDAKAIWVLSLGGC